MIFASHLPAVGHELTMKMLTRSTEENLKEKKKNQKFEAKRENPSKDDLQTPKSSRKPFSIQNSPENFVNSPKTRRGKKLKKTRMENEEEPNQKKL